MITVKEFLDTYCTVVRDNEPASYVELMMDNHVCVEYGGVQYYVPEHADNDEPEIYEFLTDNYKL